MATITFTILAADQTRLVNSICSLRGYQATLPDMPGVPGGPNPETKAQFAMRMIREDFKNYVKQYEKIVATSSANTTFDSGFVSPDIT